MTEKDVGLPTLDQILNRLIELFRENSLRIGRFTLASGRSSNYYFDSKPTTLDPEGAYLSALLILETLRTKRIQVEAIGGMTLGADPIVSAVSAISFALRERFDPLAGFIIRKEAKGHGTRRFVEGVDLAAGARVVIIDDVCTTGGSTLKAVRAAEEAGCRVVTVMALVDREQGGGELLSDYPFVPLLTGRELLDSDEIRQRIADLE